MLASPAAAIRAAALLGLLAAVALAFSFAPAASAQEEGDPRLAPSGKWVWHWQWEESDDSVDETFARLRDAGVTGILVKVIDGTDWMSRYDSGWIEFAEVKERAAAYGLKAAAWVWGYPDEAINEQANLVGRFARENEPAFLVLNFEHAWNGHQEEAAAYASRVRELAPDVPLFYAPDPRIFPLNTSYPYTELNAVTDGVMLMVYWHVFEWHPVDALRYVTSLFREWQSRWPNPNAAIYPIAQTYGGATAEELAQFQQAVLEDGFQGISYYVYDEMRPYWDAVAGFSLEQPVTPAQPAATATAGSPPRPRPGPAALAEHYRYLLGGIY
jgi:hypothetical protein